MTERIGEAPVPGVIEDSAARWPWAVFREPCPPELPSCWEWKTAPLHPHTPDAMERGKEITDQKPLLWHPVGFSSALHQPTTQHI